MIWIQGFPLAPSVNEYLIPVPGKWAITKNGRQYQKGRFVKSKVHRNFLDQCYLWRSLNLTAFNRIHTLLHNAHKHAGNTFALRVDCFFVFHVERIFTVNGKIEQLDADNRLKPTRDALATLLDLDDKFFFAGLCEKVTTPKESNQCAIIRIEQMIPRTLDQVKAQMAMEQRGS